MKYVWVVMAAFFFAWERAFSSATARSAIYAAGCAPSG